MRSAECGVRRAGGGQKQSAANIFLEYKQILHTDYSTHSYKLQGRALAFTVPPRITIYSIYNHSNDEQHLLDNMGSSQEPPLDEIQWRSPQIAQSMSGVQTNTGRDPYVGKACPDSG